MEPMTCDQCGKAEVTYYVCTPRLSTPITITPMMAYCTVCGVAHGGHNNIVSFEAEVRASGFGYKCATPDVFDEYIHGALARENKHLFLEMLPYYKDSTLTLKREEWLVDFSYSGGHYDSSEEDMMEPDLDDPWDWAADRQLVEPGEGNAFSSRVITVGGEELHMPLLDIDGVEMKVVPSSTPGNYHLYIDKLLTWSDYVRLMDMLVELGIVDPKFVHMSKMRGMSFVRKPEEKKQAKAVVTSGPTVSQLLRRGFEEECFVREYGEEPF